MVISAHVQRHVEGCVCRWPLTWQTSALTVAQLPSSVAEVARSRLAAQSISWRLGARWHSGISTAGFANETLAQ